MIITDKIGYLLCRWLIRKGLLIQKDNVLYVMYIQKRWLDKGFWRS